MATQWHEVEFETRTIGPLVLTTPVLRRLGCREMVHRHGPIAAQAELDHGLVAELVTPSRLSDPTALYALPSWAERFAMAALDPESERTGQVHDARAGRLVDALDEQRAVIWGELGATAARHYGLAWHRRHADPRAMTFAGLFADQPAHAGVPRLEPGDHPAGEWRQPLKRFARAAGDGGLPVWCDVWPGGPGASPTSAPPCAAFSDHAQRARFVPVEDILLLGDRKRPPAEHQWTWLRLHLGSSAPIPLHDQHRQTLRDVVEAGHTWQAWPSVATREAAKRPAQRTRSRGLGPTVTVTAPQAPARDWAVRPLYGPSSALASREAARRQSAIQAIAAELQRLQGWVNKDDAQTPEIITRRVQSQAVKKRPAPTYFPMAVVHPAARPTAPLDLRSSVHAVQVQRDAAREGVSLLVAGGKAAPLSDAERVAEWKGP
jgi:hypothetical protein